MSQHSLKPELRPSPLLKEPMDPLEHSTPSGHDNPQDIPEQPEDDDDENEKGEPQPPSELRPFYTLIKDTITLPTHHNERIRHPHVHYLFKDDDPLLLTHALLYYLDGSTAPTSPSDERRSSSRSLSRARLNRDTDEEDERPRQMPDIPSTERTLILDMDATGRKVVKAQSLTSAWQVQRADVGPAPTFDGEDESGLMLMIEGVENSFPVWTKRWGTARELADLQEHEASNMLSEAKASTHEEGRTKTEDLLAAVDSLRARFDEGLHALHARTGTEE